MRAFALPSYTGGPVKIMLTDFWKHPDVVADIGVEFTGFRQLTGACVGASGGNADFTVIAGQRLLAQFPAKAIIPWWPFTYGRTRFNEGDRGEGEGAVDSIYGDTVTKEGLFGTNEAPGLPIFNRSDGFALTTQIELAWSDGGSQLVTSCLQYGSKHPMGTRGPLNSSDQAKSAIINGYPVLDGCEYYIGTGSIVSGGGTPYVKGKLDGRGGHSTCLLGYWDHPNDGPLFLYSNQWDASTYPTDPAGAGRCCVWTPQSEIDKMFRYGANNGEMMALSNLQGLFPTQPEVLDFSTI